MNRTLMHVRVHATWESFYWPPLVQCMLIRRTSTTHRLIENGRKDLSGADGRVRVVGELEEEEDGAREELHHGDDDPGVDLGHDSIHFEMSPKTIKEIQGKVAELR